MKRRIHQISKRCVSLEALEAHYLQKCTANYEQLTPLHFLFRTRETFPDQLAVIHNEQRFTYHQFSDRCLQLALALTRLGVVRGSTVSILCPNTPPMLEAHFAVGLAGGILNPLNIRLDANTIAFTLQHAETDILLTDTEFAPVVSQALDMLPANKRPKIVDIQDEGINGERLGDIEYEEFIGGENPDLFTYKGIHDEWFPISLNYTSGTTGDPKGVLLSHRGALLNCFGDINAWNMTQNPIYLWTLPMFHCNGWCFPWAITKMAGTHVCLRKVSQEGIFDAFSKHGVTHLCGAPIVMSMVCSATPEQRTSFSQKVNMMTAASPPPAKVLQQMEEMSIDVTHVYGLTEVYGPSVVCAPHPEWSTLNAEAKAEKTKRQGVRFVSMEGLMIAHPETLEPVPKDGETMGEVFMRGNILFNGYLKNEKATVKDFSGGWFHTGDLGVIHPDNYIELKDRSKDIIISGGENITLLRLRTYYISMLPSLSLPWSVCKTKNGGSSIEVRFGNTVTDQDMLEYRLVPKKFVFGTIPENVYGKDSKVSAS